MTHNTQHVDIQQNAHNETQHKTNENETLSIMRECCYTTIYVDWCTPSVMKLALYNECHNTECHGTRLY